MTPRTANVAAAWLALGLAIAPAFAQDADPFGGGFDPDQPIRLAGQVRGVQWTNPRSWLFVIVENPDSAVPTEFAVMLPSIAALEWFGWTRETLSPGESVTIDGHRATGDEPRALARRIVTAEGETLLDLEAQPIRYSNSGAGLIPGKP